MPTEWELLLIKTKNRLNCGYKEASHEASLIYRRKAYYRAYYKSKRQKEKEEQLLKNIIPKKEIVRQPKKKIIKDTINNGDRLKLSPIIIFN